MILRTAVSPITGLVDEAYPLMVALNSEKPWAWFYSNYIQIVFKNDEHRGYNIRFYKTDHRGIMWDTMNPWIKYNIINVSFLKELGIGIIDFVIRSIDSGYYLSVYLDRYYVRGVRNYQQSHMTHEAMVFGYDNAEKKIHLMEYAGAYLSPFVISFSAFKDAYDNSDLNRYDAINLLRLDTERRYQFDLVNVSEQMRDYLSSTNTSERYRNNSNPIKTPFVTFGIDAYREARRLLDYDRLQSDYRVFNSIWEHKKVMTERVRYMEEKRLAEGIGAFLPLCGEVENLAYLVKSQFMKFTVTQKPKALQTVYDLFDEMIVKEEVLIRGMLCVIDKQIERNRRLEAAPWTSKHDFVSGTHKLSVSKGRRLTVEFDAVPHHDGIDGVIGYADSQSYPVGYAALKCRVRFNPAGYIEARNGDRYSAEEFIPYRKNSRYHIYITVDFDTQSYCARVSSGDQVWRLAERYAFSPSARAADDIDKVMITTDNDTFFSLEHHSVSALPS